MNYYIKQGNIYNVTDRENLDIHETLPPGNLLLKMDQKGSFYLEKIDDFSFGGKRYGSHNKFCDRIFNTFMSRDNSTGVLLAGEKGSGKSLLAKLVCMKGNTENMPTIIITEPYSGGAFAEFLQSINQPAIVFFDEFEKVYSKVEYQDSILSLLDGVFPSKKLFLLTCNDKNKINSYMTNRPGRIFYMVDFYGLEKTFIIEYCQDNLVNKDYINKVVNIATLFGSFNFDMLKALVEEMNRYDETPEDALNYLNIKVGFESWSKTYVLELKIGGKSIDKEMMHNPEAHFNPLKNNLDIAYKKTKKSDWIYSVFTLNDLVKIDGDKKIYLYQNEDGDEVMATEKAYVTPNYYKFAAES